MNKVTQDFTVEPDCREVVTIVKKYTEAEKQDFANRAATLNETLKDIEAQKKDAISDFNATIKNLKSDRDALTSRRARGFEEDREKCAGYLEMAENGRYDMVFYDSTGLEVYRRTATPSERQSSLFTRDQAVNE